MKLQNLKTNPKFNYGKTILAGTLIGGVVAIGAVTVANGVAFGHFKPIMSYDDQITTHKVTSRFYYKGGEQIKNRYLTENDIKRLYVLKEHDKEANTDNYYFYDAEELSIDQIDYVKKYLDTANKYDLETIKYFLNNNCERISSSNHNLDFYKRANDSYGLTFIINDEYKDETRKEAIFENRSKSMVDTVEGMLVCMGLISGGLIGTVKANNDKKKQKIK